MNLIYKALQILCSNKLLTREVLVAELKLDCFTAERILEEIALMTLSQTLVSKVEHFNEEGRRNGIRIQLLKSGLIPDFIDYLEICSLKTESRLFSPIKKNHFAPNRTKDYSTRKRTGPLSSKPTYPKTEIDQILEGSTYTSVEEKDQSRLEKLLKRKAAYSALPEKCIKKKNKRIVQGTISSFFARNS